MSDKYIQIASFKYGLDARRQELVSQPGELETCENCHVNAGGELEKRKAFVADSVLFPTNTFGLQDTDEGLMTFGSDAAPNAALPTGVVYQRLLPAFLDATEAETVTLAGTASANGAYLRNGVLNGKAFYGDFTTKWIAWYPAQGLLLPRWLITVRVAGVDTIMYGSSGGASNVATPDLVTPWGLGAGVAPLPTVTHTATSHVGEMSKVVYSCNYLGKAFVIAEFITSAGVETFCFYDGALVGPSRYGQVLLDSGGAVEDPSDLSQDLADQVNLIDGWVGVANKDVNAALAEFTAPGCTIIRSPPGISFEPVILDEDGNPLWDSTSGIMTRRLSDSNVAGDGEIRAKAAFSFDAGTTGTCDVQAPYVVDGTGVATLTGGPISFITSLAVTAQAVVDAVNAHSTLTGYTASLSGVQVTVTAPVGFGNVTFNLVVITTLTLSTVAQTPIAGALHVTFSPALINQVSSTGNPTRFFFGSISAVVDNRVGAPDYTWTETDPSGLPVVEPSGIAIGNYKAATTQFTATVAKGQTRLGYFRCDVASVGAIGTPTFGVVSVKFSYV